MIETVPLVDLAWQHRQVAQEVERGVAGVLERTDFIGGKAVEAFEREYADYLDVPYCLGVGNGTDALEIALRALSVGPGDEVILPANTFVATAEAVARVGARIVLADCDPEHYTLDPNLALEAVTSRTRAVMPVHLYGQAASVEPLLGLAEIAVVEDAAQSQGATRYGRPAGSLGVAAGTSFYPGKNLGAYGDAGAVMTTSEPVARRARLIANHGSERKYQHDEVGFNSRLDTIQAVVLSAKLRRLDEWNRLRRSAAATYDALLTDLDAVVRPSTLEGNEHVWHLYVVRVPDRDRVIAALQAAGIGAGIHYPLPVHLHPAFIDLGYRPGSFPVAEEVAGQILSLPLFPGITEAQQERVVDELRAAV